jgi:hypothetical protein
VPRTVIDAEESDSPLWRQRLTALQAWYDAEYARAHRSTEEPGLWISMGDECVESRPPWLETYAEAVCPAAGRVGRRGSGCSGPAMIWPYDWRTVPGPTWRNSAGWPMWT